MQNHLKSVLLSLQLQCVRNKRASLTHMPWGGVRNSWFTLCFPWHLAATCHSPADACTLFLPALRLFLHWCPEAEVARPFCSSPVVRMCVGSSGHLWPNSTVEDPAHYLLLSSVVLHMVMCSHLQKKKVQIQQCNTIVSSSLKKFFWRQESSMKS